MLLGVGAPAPRQCPTCRPREWPGRQLRPQDVRQVRRRPADDTPSAVWDCPKQLRPQAARTGMCFRLGTDPVTRLTRRSQNQSRSGVS